MARHHGKQRRKRSGRSHKKHDNVMSNHADSAKGSSASSSSTSSSSSSSSSSSFSSSSSSSSSQKSELSKDTGQVPIRTTRQRGNAENPAQTVEIGFSVSNTEDVPKKRQRTCKCKCIKKELLGSPDETSPERRISERLQIKNYKLPYQNLPRECKIHVFSYLNIFERGQAAQVCQEWRDLIQLPGVWSDVDLSVFNNLRPKQTASKHKSSACMDCRNYRTYVKRVASFLEYLQGVRPALKRLSLALDFGVKSEKWSELVTDILKVSRCNELASVHLTWCQTPQRPLCFDNFCCHFNKARSLCQLHVERVGVFHHFFADFSKLAAGVKQLSIPFPWTWRSVRYLCRLRSLQSLTLGKYFLLRNPDQAMLTTILDNLPNLQQLKLVVCVPFYNQRTMYSISHPRLEMLDISECQGFFLNQLHLPSLRVIRISRQRWQGALLNPNIIPCVTNLLLDGALNVTHINKFRLDVYWKEYEYEELKSHLQMVCPCFRHALQWQ